jgi:acylphosphatase
MSETVTTKRLVIHGRVQGVYFRDSMRQLARRHGVTGWVRNRSDGSVEAIVQGKPDAVEKIIKWAHRGPDAAKVIGVQIEEAQGQFDSFDLLFTA